MHSANRSKSLQTNKMLMIAARARFFYFLFAEPNRWPRLIDLDGDIGRY